MTDFKIGGAPLRPTPEAAGAKKTTAKEQAREAAAPSKGGFDTASVNPNRLAVMPRMSKIGGESAQCIQGEAVETLLRDAAAELDDYFTKAYGFGE